MDFLMDRAAPLPTLFTTDAEDAARQTGFRQRRRKLSGATVVQTLVFGWLRDPDAARDDRTDFSADRGRPLSPQALDQRRNVSATQLLAAVWSQALHHVVAAEPLTLPLRRRFQGVSVFDTPTLSRPAPLAELFRGCGGRTSADGQAARKCHVGLERTGGALQRALGAGRRPDGSSERARSPLPAGALRRADRGFFNREVLRDYSAAGVFWLSRAPANLKVRTADGAARPLRAWRRSAPDGPLDLEVPVGEPARRPCRLLAVRVPAAVARQRRQRLQQRARKAKKGQRPKISAAQWALWDWPVALPNVGAGTRRAAEAWVLLRARWQVELLFKLWKSHGGLDRSRGERAARVLCAVYAKLLAMLVQHWVRLAAAGPSLAYSHVKGARRVRRAALRLAQALGRLTALVEVLVGLAQRLGKKCRVQPRGNRPTTYDLLRDPARPTWTEDNDEEQHRQAA